MWNHAAPHDPINEILLIEKAWEDPGVVFHEVLETDGEVQGFALGVIRKAQGDVVGYLKMLAVAPAERGAGIGSRLLKGAETALQTHGARLVRIGGSPPNYLSPGVDDRYGAGLTFLQKHGYRVSGETENMTVVLDGQDWTTDGDEAGLLRQGVTVRRAVAGDHEQLKVLANHFGGTWIDEIERALALDPVGVHLAWRGDQLLGFAAWGGNNTAAGWFGPMGTLPEARGLGIGGVLLKRCLRDLQRQGFKASVIPWVGPVGFYQRHAGANVSARLIRMEKTLDPGVAR